MKDLPPVQMRQHQTSLAKLYGVPAPKFSKSKPIGLPSKLSLSHVPYDIKIWGDKAYRGECELEWKEQAKFVKNVRKVFYESHGKLLIHIKNEGLRTDGEARNAKMMGMTSGAPDIIIPARVPFLCEIKRADPTKSSTTQAQIDYLTAAQAQGAYVCYALGADAAWEALEQWIKMC